MDFTLQQFEKFNKDVRRVFASKRCSFIPEPATQTKKRGLSRVFR
jgi:hypothetical protein